MRNIIFRGYDVANERWVYGITYAPFDTAIIRTIDGEEVTILPESLGQYTGLKDKNGREIYEGDIVDVWSSGSHLPNGIIKWGKGSCRFFIGNYINSCCWSLAGDSKGNEVFEIIGNIHDNPELLKL